MEELGYEKYMLTKENIIKLLPQKFYNQKYDKFVSKQKKIVNNDDILFWTIYKLVNKDDIYQTSSNFKTEKDFKIKCIEDMRNIKSNFKTYKLNLNDIENQLLNEKKINLQAFFGLALLFNLNIFYVFDNKFYEFNCNSESEPYIIKNSNNIITIEDNNIEYYRENYYQILNLNKPIKSITSYSKNELLLMAKKLNINDIQEKTNKNDIYNKILLKV